MKISISNIAWDVHQDEAISSLLLQRDIRCIDVAPTKYFKDVFSCTDEDIRNIREWWNKKGIEIIGMQSLLFGLQGVNLFDGEDHRQQLLKHLDRVAAIGNLLGARKLVFGSPKNRDRKNLDDVTVAEIAQDFFYRLGQQVQKYDVIICLEPNPARYGANFMLNSEETAKVVRSVQHPHIKMQFDSGAVTINGEDPASVMSFAKPLIGHVHISEPGLVAIGEGTCPHVEVSRVLGEYLPEMPVTIEMTSGSGFELGVIERVLDFMVSYYGGRDL